MNRTVFTILSALAVTFTACGDTRDETSAATTAATVTGGSGDTDPEPDPTTTGGNTTGSATDGSGGDDSGGSTGGIFIMDPDGGDGGNECDVWEQDCPAGTKCMPWANDGGAWNATKCTDVDANPGQVGDPCTPDGNGASGVDDCDAGLMCYNVQVEDGMGTCYELCGGSPASPSCDTESTACEVYNDGVLPLCLWQCDPLLQDCPGVELCLSAPSGEGFVCVLDSDPDGEGGYGTPCEFVNQCDAGFFCGNAEIVPGCVGSDFCCSQFCDLTVDEPNSQCEGAAEGQECLAWFGEQDAPPGTEHVGYCGIPQ